MFEVQSITPQWVQHQCNIAGCSEDMVTIDGNEKLTRAVSKEKVKCPLNHINLVQCCSQSPISGGKHQVASKYCDFHQYLVSSASHSLDEQLNLTVRLNFTSPPFKIFGQSLAVLKNFADSAVITFEPICS
jgi:hypothetical protein